MVYYSDDTKTLVYSQNIDDNLKTDVEVSLSEGNKLKEHSEQNLEAFVLVNVPPIQVWYRVASIPVRDPLNK